MQKWISLVVLTGCLASLGAGYPVLSAVAKHPLGDGRYLLVVPGYQGLPLYVDRNDRLIEPPAETFTRPTTWLRLSDGSVVYRPQELPSPIRVNPAPATIVFPMPLRTGWDGPPKYGP